MKRRALAAWAARTRAADRLTRGSALLWDRTTDRAAAWIRAGRRSDLDGLPAALGCWVRAALLAATLGIGYLILRAVPWLMWALAGGWCWRAWKAGRTTPAEGQEEADEKPLEPLNAPAVHALLRELIGEGRGVHLSTLLDHLPERGLGQARTVADVRAGLAALGVPVRRSLKVAGKVAYGVHRDDLPPLPQADAPASSTDASTAA